MVGPSRSLPLGAIDSSGPTGSVRPAQGRLRSLVLVLALASVPAGCAIVPKSKLDESHQLIQTLRSENAQLKDVALRLRSQSQDMTERAVDDERRIKLLEETNQQLERSVMAYQDLRDKWEANFQRMKAEVQSSVKSVSSGLLNRFETFAANHPGCRFDRDSAVLTIAADQLFERGTDRLKPGAVELLRDARTVLDDREARDLNLLVVGLAEASAIERTSLNKPSSAGQHLSLARAARVRERLAAEASVDPSRVSVAGYELPPSDAEGAEGKSKPPARRIEIHLRAPGALPEPSEAPTGLASRPAPRRGEP